MHDGYDDDKKTRFCFAELWHEAVGKKISKSRKQTFEIYKFINEHLILGFHVQLRHLRDVSTLGSNFIKFSLYAKVSTSADGNIQLNKLNLHVTLRHQQKSGKLLFVLCLGEGKCC